MNNPKRNPAEVKAAFQSFLSQILEQVMPIQKFSAITNIGNVFQEFGVGCSKPIENNLPTDLRKFINDPPDSYFYSFGQIKYEKSQPENVYYISDLESTRYAYVIRCGENIVQQGKGTYVVKSNAVNEEKLK